MARLRAKEIRAMRQEDLQVKMRELNDELMHERGVAAMGGAPASPGRLRAIRSNVARIHTIMRELELAERTKAAEKAPGKGGKGAARAAPEAARPDRKRTRKQEKPGEEKEEKK